MRVQGDPRRRRCTSCSTRCGMRRWFFDTELLVARRSARDAHPRGAGRLGRRSRLSRRHRVHGARRPARRRTPGDGHSRWRVSSRSALCRRSPTRCCSWSSPARSAPPLANAVALAAHRGRQHRGQPPPHVRDPRPRRPARHQAAGFLVFVLALGLTNGALSFCMISMPTLRGCSRRQCWCSPRSPRLSRATSRCRRGCSAGALEAIAPTPSRPSIRKETEMSTTTLPRPTLPRPADQVLVGRSRRSLVRGRAEDPAWARMALHRPARRDRGRVSLEPDAPPATPTASTPPPCRRGRRAGRRSSSARSTRRTSSRSTSRRPRCG